MRLTHRSMSKNEHSTATMKNLLQAAGIFCLFAVCPVVVADAKYAWSDVPRIVAISDPHGAYGALVRTLQNAGVLDEQTNWSGGLAHLVITGDLLDRGPDSRQLMTWSCDWRRKPNRPAVGSTYCSAITRS